MKEESLDEFDILRSMFRTDDDLQVRTSGDVNRISLKLDNDLYISFFHDPVQALTINNLHELQISKPTNNKNTLKNEQWINIRNYFNKLIQQSESNTFLTSIIPSIQEYIQHIIKEEPKSNSSNSFSTTIFRSKSDASTLIKKFRSADLIFNRILHDSTIDRSQILIGYEDRFTGIHEIKFNEFKKVHESEVIEFFFYQIIYFSFL